MDITLRFAFFYCIPSVCTGEMVQATVELIRTECRRVAIERRETPLPGAIVTHEKHLDVFERFHDVLLPKRHLFSKKFCLTPLGEVWHAEQVVLGATASTMDPQTGVETILYLGETTFIAQLLREMRRCGPEDERFNFDEGDLIEVVFLADNRVSHVRTTNHTRVAVAA